MKTEQPTEQWSPKLVGERLVAAVAWAQHAAGQVGPGQMRSAALAYHPTWEERLEEGWGLPDGPDEQELAMRQRRLRVAATPEQITRYLAALEWPLRYLVPAHAGDARVLNLWVRCKVLRRPFAEAVDLRKYLSRPAAYRMRDRALTLISVGLDKDGVPL